VGIVGFLSSLEAPPAKSIWWVGDAGEVIDSSWNTGK